MAKKTEYKARIIPAGRTQENFNIKNDSLEKVKDIAAAENTSKADIYNRAIDKYIELYEKKNGKVKPRPKGSGLI